MSPGPEGGWWITWLEILPQPSFRFDQSMATGWRVLGGAQSTPGPSQVSQVSNGLVLTMKSPHHRAVNDVLDLLAVWIKLARASPVNGGINRLGANSPNGMAGFPALRLSQNTRLLPASVLNEVVDR
jgi:hypothetical protein